MLGGALLTWRFPLLVVCGETEKSPQPIRAEAIALLVLLNGESSGKITQRIQIGRRII